jgi:hypothetical protein
MVFDVQHIPTGYGTWPGTFNCAIRLFMSIFSNFFS